MRIYRSSPSSQADMAPVLTPWSSTHILIEKSIIKVHYADGTGVKT